MALTPKTNFIEFVRLFIEAQRGNLTKDFVKQFENEPAKQDPIMIIETEDQISKAIRRELQHVREKTEAACLLYYNEFVKLHPAVDLRLSAIYRNIAKQYNAIYDINDIDVAKKAHDDIITIMINNKILGVDENTKFFPKRSWEPIVEPRSE